MRECETRVNNSYFMIFTLITFFCFCFFFLVLQRAQGFGFFLQTVRKKNSVQFSNWMPSGFTGTDWFEERKTGKKRGDWDKESESYNGRKCKHIDWYGTRNSCRTLVTVSRQSIACVQRIEEHSKRWQRRKNFRFAARRRHAQFVQYRCRISFPAGKFTTLRFTLRRRLSAKMIRKSFYIRPVPVYLLKILHRFII